MNYAGALRLFERLRIEVTEHQDFAGLVVLNHSRDESSKFFECQFHDSPPKTKNPLDDARQRAD